MNIERSELTLGKRNKKWPFAYKYFDFTKYVNGSYQTYYQCGKCHNDK